MEPCSPSLQADSLLSDLGKVKVKLKSLSHVQLFGTSGTNTVHGILQARILEWVAVPFSRASSRPRSRTGVSCIAGGFFTNWSWEYFKTGFVPGVELIQETQLQPNRPVGGALIPNQASSITPNRSRPIPTSATRGCRSFSSPTNDDHNQHPATAADGGQQHRADRSGSVTAKCLLGSTSPWETHCPPTKEWISVKYQSAHLLWPLLAPCYNDPYHSVSRGSVFTNDVWVSALGVASFFCCSVAQSYRDSLGPRELRMPGFPVLHNLWGPLSQP